MLFSAALPGERLARHHVIGAGLGLAGVVVLGDGARRLGGAIEPAHLVGYGAALACAVVWAAYSVSSRLFQRVPTEAVAGFCLATAALAGVGHLLFETTVWPAARGNGSPCWSLGLGPVGLAF